MTQAILLIGLSIGSTHKSRPVMTPEGRLLARFKAHPECFNPCFGHYDPVSRQRPGFLTYAIKPDGLDAQKLGAEKDRDLQARLGSNRMRTVGQVQMKVGE